MHSNLRADDLRSEERALNRAASPTAFTPPALGEGSHGKGPMKGVHTLGERRQALGGCGSWWVLPQGGQTLGAPPVANRACCVPLGSLGTQTWEGTVVGLPPSHGRLGPCS